VFGTTTWWGYGEPEQRLVEGLNSLSGHGRGVWERVTMTGTGTALARCRNAVVRVGWVGIRRKHCRRLLVSRRSSPRAGGVSDITRTTSRDWLRR
jgi:hypothetical protein